MKKISRMQGIALVLALLSPAVTAVFYGRLPAEIPTHWGLDGTVTYGAKSTLWLLGGLPAALWCLFVLLPSIDPRRESYRKFRGVYDALNAVMMLFFLGMICITISEAMNPERISVAAVVTAGCGLLFAFLGNMMPKFKSNFFVGIKTPWTLSSTEVWNRTHRFAGYLWFAGGILIVPLAVLLPNEKLLFGLFMAIILVMAFLPMVMSYVWYRRGQKEEQG